MKLVISKKRSILDIVIVIALLSAAIAALAVIIVPRLQPDDPAPVVDTSKKSTADKTPALKTEVIAGVLDHPWEVAILPDATPLITERSGDISKIVKGKKTILAHPDDVYARGEGGMLGLTVDPAFQTNHYIYTCFNSSLGGLDIRVVRWKLDDKLTSLTDRKDIITGIPSAQSGRHSGCRLAFGPDDHLWVGTGDAAQGNNPQNLKNLGGKILRTDREGKGVDGNLGGSADPRIYSYGHRNTQGLAFYTTPRGGSVGLSIEHGPDIDDEINPLVKGNFGWSPPPPYDERLPMTDLGRFPDAIKETWSSGDHTIAPSDADILVGEQWGKWQGYLAMGVLKEKHLRLLQIKSDGTIGEELRLFDREFGRIRAVAMATDGSLYLTTDNGANQDFVLKVTPEL